MKQALPESAITHDSDFIIIGGGGDLSIRKIFPALFWRFLNGQITRNFRLICCMRNIIAKEQFAKKLRPFCEEAFKCGVANTQSWDDFVDLLQILELDVLNEKRLREIIKKYTPNVIEIKAVGNTFTEQTFYHILLGDWISVYLAELNQVDDVEVKVIDYLKSELAKI